MCIKRVKSKIGNKKAILAICTGFFCRAKGLMFSKPLKDNEALLFEFKKEARWPIHMLFVFFPIKVAFLDKNRKVAEVRKAKPFISFIMPRKKCRYVLEVNKDFKVKVGDKLFAF